MLTCIKCKQTLNIDDFYKNKSNKNGIQQPCKECKKELQKQYYEEHIDYRKKYDKIYGDAHREYRNAQQRLYNALNKDEITERERQKRKNNVTYNINCNVNSRLRACIKQNFYKTKWNKTEELFSFNFKQLKEYFESLFTPEMNWNNYGDYWEIDHIIPMNQFSFTSYTDKDFQICWSLMNLRPLEKSLNRSRPKDGSDIPEELKYKILHQFDGKEE